MDEQAFNQGMTQLDDQQRAAVMHGTGPMAIDGNPGSGKTRTVVHRIGRLVQAGLPGQYIAAFTFTRAAAQEMNTRLRDYGIVDVEVRTLHSLCSGYLREQGIIRTSATGKPLLNLIRSEEAYAFMVLQVLRKGGFRVPVSMQLADALAFITLAKGRCLCWVDGDPWGLNSDAERELNTFARRFTRISGCAARPKDIVAMYIDVEHERAEQKRYTYDDMLLWTWLDLIHPGAQEVRRDWSHRWTTVIVDEAQDNNIPQWDIASVLTGLPPVSAAGRRLVTEGSDLPGNLCAAGDAAQSIYEFRAACPEVFVEFVKRQTDPSTHLYPLQVNYRSTPHVCHTAAAIVKGKPWHLAGDMIPHRTDGAAASVLVKGYATVQCEIEGALDEIQERCAAGEPLHHMAVLSRMSVFLHLFELECITRQVPYVKRCKGTFFESAEVTDVLAYMNTIAGLPDPDGAHIRRCINKPFRYIGKAAISEALEALATPGLDAGHDAWQTWSGTVLARVKSYVNHTNQIADIHKLGRVISKARGASRLADVMHIVVHETGYAAAAGDDIRSAVAPAGHRAAVLQGMQQRAAAFTGTAAEFIQYVHEARAATKALQKTVNAGSCLPANRLMLSTIHSAKGLEWKHVHLADVVAGRFPSGRSPDSEEELRLLYVGITRAEDTCTVSYARDSKMSSFIYLLREIFGEDYSEAGF